VNRIGHWISNKMVLGTSGRSGAVYNPATGEQQATVDFANVAELDAVVAVAKAALPAWRATSLSRRAEIMFRMRELVDANRKEIANIVSLEHGKVPADAMGELARGLENIRSEEHTSALQSRVDLLSFPTRRSSDLRARGCEPQRDRQHRLTRARQGAS